MSNDVHCPCFLFSKSSEPRKNDYLLTATKLDKKVNSRNTYRGHSRCDMAVSFVVPFQLRHYLLFCFRSNDCDWIFNMPSNEPRQRRYCGRFLVREPGQNWTHHGIVQEVVDGFYDDLRAEQVVPETALVVVAGVEEEDVPALTLHLVHLKKERDHQRGDHQRENNYRYAFYN